MPSDDIAVDQIVLARTRSDPVGLRGHDVASSSIAPEQAREWFARLKPVLLEPDGSRRRGPTLMHLSFPEADHFQGADVTVRVDPTDSPDTGAVVAHALIWPRRIDGDIALELESWEGWHSAPPGPELPRLSGRELIAKAAEWRGRPMAGDPLGGRLESVVAQILELGDEPLVVYTETIPPRVWLRGMFDVLGVGTFSTGPVADLGPATPWLTLTSGRERGEWARGRRFVDPRLGGERPELRRLARELCEMYRSNCVPARYFGLNGDQAEQGPPWLPAERWLSLLRLADHPAVGRRYPRLSEAAAAAAVAAYFEPSAELGSWPDSERWPTWATDGFRHGIDVALHSGWRGDDPAVLLVKAAIVLGDRFPEVPGDWFVRRMLLTDAVRAATMFSDPARGQWLLRATLSWPWRMQRDRAYVDLLHMNAWTARLEPDEARRTRLLAAVLNAAYRHNPVAEVLAILTDKTLSEEDLPVLAALRTIVDDPAVLRRLDAHIAGVRATPGLPPELKVILVGEGFVGKTSLVAALRDEPFKDHDRTLGIDISTLDLRRPADAIDLTLRFWDFGGQPAYRFTHELYYSVPALYLLVWNARAGHRKDDVDGWMRRVSARVGAGARVLSVATHCDQHLPDLDVTELRERYPGMLLGDYAVDNASGRGIEEFRTALVAHAETLLQQDEQIRGAWVAARRTILDLAADVPQVPYRRFAELCVEHGLDEGEADELARHLNRRGLIHYLPDDELLREMVVLNPEWVSKAIGHVLEDQPTMEAGGVLDHDRLPEIWRKRPGEPRYERHHYPYFLALMQAFGISFRLDGGRHSLVAQLVPALRPDLPWDRATPLAAPDRMVTLLCELDEPVPGLVAALTVRLSPADAKLRWRRGAFLRSSGESERAEALVELVDERRLVVQVRGPSPDAFCHVIFAGVEHTLRRSSPNAPRLYFVPCDGQVGTEPCASRFRLDRLRKARALGDTSWKCHECFTEHDIGRLLTGFPTAPEPDAAVVEIRRVEQRLDAMQTAGAELLRQLLISDSEARDGPRLFTVVRVRSTMDRVKIHREHYRLTLWCEHPDGPHPWGTGYDLNPPRGWFVRVSRYTRFVFSALRHAVPLAGGIAGFTLTGAELERANKELDAMGKLLTGIPAVAEVQGTEPLPTVDRPDAAAGAELRVIHALINEHDPMQRYEGLERVRGRTDYQWLCPAHAAQLRHDMSGTRTPR